MADFISLIQAISAEAGADSQKLVSGIFLLIISTSLGVLVSKATEIQKWVKNHSKEVSETNEAWPHTSEYKAFSYKINRKTFRGADDKAYLDPQIGSALQKWLPRGLTIVYNAGDSIVGLVYGFAKFFGKTHNDNDEDDIEADMTVSSEAVSFVKSVKANGEAAQVICIKSGVWVIGSKNAKAIFHTVSLEKDLEVYKKDKNNRYGFTTEIAELWFAFLNTLSVTKINELESFLLHTEMTLDFEMESVDHQHIIVLHVNRLVLINMTNPYFPRGIHPVALHAFAKYFRFTSVVEDSTIYPIEKLEDVCREVAYDHTKEGAVLYLLNKDKDSIQMLKVKSIWYMALRALREKLARYFEGRETIRCRNAWRKRIDELVRDIGWPTDLGSRLKGFGDLVIDWLLITKTFSPGFSSNDLRDHYPLLIDEFMSAKRYTVEEVMTGCGLVLMEPQTLQTSQLYWLSPLQTNTVDIEKINTMLREELESRKKSNYVILNSIEATKSDIVGAFYSGLYSSIFVWRIGKRATGKTPTKNEINNEIGAENTIDVVDMNNKDPQARFQVNFCSPSKVELATIADFVASS